MHLPRVWVVVENPYPFQQVRCIALFEPPARALEPLDGRVHGIRSRLLDDATLALRMLPGGDCQNSADNRKGELQMEIDRERPDISEAVPDRTAHRNVYGLDLDAQTKPV